MKKIFYVLICFLFSLSIVNAKTEIKYEWGKSLYSGYSVNHELMGGIRVNNGELEFVAYIEDSTNNIYKYSYYKFDSEGNFDVVPFENSADKYYGLLNNRVITTETIDSVKYFVLYDEEMNEIKKISVDSFPDLPLVAENEEYYLIGEQLFSKKTDELVSFEDLLDQNKVDAIKAANEAGETEKAQRLMLELYMDAGYWSYYPLLSYFFMSTSDETWITNVGHEGYEMISQFFLNSINKKGGFALPYFSTDSETPNFIVDIYDRNYEVTNSITTNIPPIKVIFKEDKFYIIGFNEKEETDTDGNVVEKCYLRVEEYDNKGNKTSSFDLSDISTYASSREIYNIVESEDGFYLLTYDTSLSEDVTSDTVKGSYINGDDPVLLKFTFNYDIQVNNDGNGDIEIVKSSKPGEGVTFKVTPKEGYELKEIRVTDANGNVLIVTDYEFTMPSSDVTIDAVFQKKIINPETSDIMILGFLILAFIGIYYSVSKSKKVKWLNS